MVNIKYTPREEIINWFNDNILYSEDKIKDLSYNLFNDINYSETTAFTVGIVWDWWIGKTSFMNLLLNYLYENEKKEWNVKDNIDFDSIINQNWLNELSKNYYIMKINSWLLEKSTIQSEYVIVDYILREIAKNNKDINSNIKKFFDKFKDLDVEIEVPFFKVWMKWDTLISTKLIDSFVSEFKKEVKKFLNNKKIILIIDDLDRIPPQEAIAMMDSIKLFLDDSHFIVFFLNDKRIINEWLREKFGENIWKDIANEYLDKLMQVDIDLKKYLDTKDYETWIKNFIKEHPYIKSKVPNLINELEKEENKKIFEEILKLSNFRKVKKLFRNLQVQWPSLYKNNYDEGRLKSVLEYLKEELSKKDN